MKKTYIYGDETACATCEKTFRPRDKGSKQKFCSYACRGVHQTQQAIKKCAVCEKDFMPSRPSYKTCSRPCGVAFRSARRVRDPMVEIRAKLAVFCCTVIARCLRNKTDRTAELLGYSAEELRTHLEKHFEPGMSWENYGKGMDSWSIDHSRPITKFPATATLAEINALENLRPMWHRKNCAKKNKWEGQ